MHQWYRVGMQRSALGSCPHWLSGRDASLTVQQFREWWGASGVLCSVHEPAGGQRLLSVHWNTTVPVPLPPAVPAPLPADPGDEWELGPGLVVDLGAEWDLGELDTFD